MTTQELTDIGFLNVGFWWPSIRTSGRIEPQVVACDRDTPNVLYAFVVNDLVMYIGETERPLSRRFTSYSNPGMSDNGSRTDRRICRQVAHHMSRGNRVHIYVLVRDEECPGSECFGPGERRSMEQYLIREHRPEWNH